MVKRILAFFTVLTIVGASGIISNDTPAGISVFYKSRHIEREDLELGLYLVGKDGTPQELGGGTGFFFNKGDEVILTVLLKHPGYVYIFSVNRDKSQAIQIFPHEGLCPFNRLENSRAYSFPFHCEGNMPAARNTYELGHVGTEEFRVYWMEGNHDFSKNLDEIKMGQLSYEHCTLDKLQTLERNWQKKLGPRLFSKAIVVYVVE